jgi:hypothetical protein
MAFVPKAQRLRQKIASKTKLGPGNVLVVMEALR